MKKMTHEAIYKNPIGGKSKMLLRETKNYWVSEHGTKYKKYNGYAAGDKWPMSGIIISSIKQIQGN